MNTAEQTLEQRFQQLMQWRNEADSPAKMWTLLKQFDRFLVDYPAHIAAMHNRSDLLKHLGLYELALKEEERCLALVPDFAMGWCNKAFILNALGRYPEGWAAYEWRFKTDVATFQDPGWPIPRWTGEEIGQARLLIYAEQGLGDNIQFVRYAIEAKKRGLNVVVVNHQPLETLLNANLARYGVESAANGSSISNLSYYVSMMSLPHYFGTTLENIPSPEAYLQALPNDLAKWQRKITACKRPKIGVVWSGSVKHDRDHIRSLSFERFAQLFQFEAEFHCLQKVVTEQDLNQAQRYDSLYFWHNELHDFSDTAALIAQMDLVISVDTSVAHLAAAMGKPTWIMLSYHPDFRWLLDRNESPWYNSVKLFRQNESQTWDNVISTIYQQLNQYIQEAQYV